MLFVQQQESKQTLTNFLILFFSTVAIVNLQASQLNEIGKSSKSDSIAKIQRELKARKIELQFANKIPSFGYDNLVADLTFLNFIQYFGEEAAREKTGYSLSPDYFELILDRDPRFLNAYFLLSSSTSIFAGMPERTIAIMDEKLKLLSPKDPRRAYYIWRYKGTDELLFLGDLEASEHSFEKAAEWASVYSNEEGKRVAQLSRQTAQFLASKPDLTQAQITGWQLVYNNAQDDRSRQIAIERMEALGAIVSIDSNGRLTIAMPQPNN